MIEGPSNTAGSDIVGDLRETVVPAFRDPVPCDAGKRSPWLFRKRHERYTRSGRLGWQPRSACPFVVTPDQRPIALSSQEQNVGLVWVHCKPLACEVVAAHHHISELVCETLWSNA